MKKRIDLHTHTLASDGSMGPKELVYYAKTKGLEAIAVTDHDTVAGIEEAICTGEKIGVEVIAGIEISADFKTEMHILGYFFHSSYRAMTAVLEGLIQNRNERNPKIINKLNELGFQMTMEEVKKVSGGQIIGRPHIAKVMFMKGYVRSIEEAFDKYLASGKEAYFAKDKLTPEEAIQAIIKAGGIPVLAHPMLARMTGHHLDNMIGILKSQGLKGIEAYYTSHTAEDTGNLLRLAIKHDLIATGGSDFHGSFKPDIDIGVGRGNLAIPYEVLGRLKKVAMNGNP